MSHKNSSIHSTAASRTDAYCLYHTIYTLLPTTKQAIALFSLALFVRLMLFFGYVQYECRYQQPDSLDYHASAILLQHGFGMNTPNEQYPGGMRPIFWRTPGYPAFLATIYSLVGTKPTTIDFHDHTVSKATRAALIIQSIWCSTAPLIIYALALLLTGWSSIALLAAFICCVHPGMVLASIFLLTDGPAAIFFWLFLLCYFLAILNRTPATTTLIHAAILLSCYTWFRPMGQFIALIAALWYLFLGKNSLTYRIRNMLIFFGLCVTLLTPWIYRNYRLTGQPFFCPLFGLYLNVFSAPKIKSRIENIPLDQAHNQLLQEAGMAHYEKFIEYEARGCTYHIVGENIAFIPAWKWISRYPLYFIYDWLIEMTKTAIDLYSYQLESLYNNHFTWDPLIEHLPTKYKDVLFAKPLATWMRIVAWIELTAAALLWLGIGAGCLGALLSFTPYDRTWWLTAALFFISTCAQTGGFGYARLRLPVEPLFIIAGLFGLVFLHSLYMQAAMPRIENATHRKCHT